MHPETSFQAVPSNESLQGAKNGKDKSSSANRIALANGLERQNIWDKADKVPRRLVDHSGTMIEKDLQKEMITLDDLTYLLHPYASLWILGQKKARSRCKLSVTVV